MREKRSYLRNIWEREHVGHRLYFGQYLCRTWNATHSDGAILKRSKFTM